MERIDFTGMTEMQAKETLIALIDSKTIKNGSYINIEFKSKKKAYKAYEKENGATDIEKVTTGVVRFGINYYNTATYQQKQERIIASNGAPTPSRTSPYDHPMQGYENFLIVTEKDGEIHYKLKLFASKNGSKMTSRWYLNGVECSKDDLDGIMVKQSTTNESEFIEFTIKLENLIAIGG